MTAIKLTVGDRSSIKEQSMEIEMSARNKPTILKATVLETFETPRKIFDGNFFINIECLLIGNNR